MKRKPAAKHDGKALPPDAVRTFLASAEGYDRMVNWSARLAREVPVLVTTFGPPGRLGLLDAGCGSGRHAAALAGRGYRVTAIDSSDDMLRFARRVARDGNVRVRFVRTAFGRLAQAAPGPYDGACCIGNSLALAGSESGVRAALAGFARVIRPGGRLFVQVTNFARMRRQSAHAGCVRGPQTATIGGREYVSVKVFHIVGRKATVTGVTLWQDRGTWQREVFQGHLVPIEAAPLARWLAAAGFRILARQGSYAGEPYDAEKSDDLIVIAERTQT